jgi:predicted enzyme related to lactoylglutathione lyase
VHIGCRPVPDDCSGPVSNCDETAGKAKELAGKTLLAPMNIEKVGRMAILADPQGAVLPIISA